MAGEFLQQRLDALGSGLAGVTETVERNSPDIFTHKNFITGPPRF